MIYYIVGERGKSTFLRSLGFPICRDKYTFYDAVQKGHKNICLDDVNLRNDKFFENIFNSVVLETYIIMWKKFQGSMKIHPKKDLNLYVTLSPSEWEEFPSDYKKNGICLNIEQKENCL